MSPFYIRKPQQQKICKGLFYYSVFCHKRHILSNLFRLELAGFLVVKIKYILNLVFAS